MENRNLDKILPFIEGYNKGEIIYKDGALYRTVKLTKIRKIPLEEPQLMRTDSTRGYWRVTMYGQTCYEHLVIFAIFNGIDSLKDFEHIDHIDTNKKNNNIENLEGVTAKENAVRASQKGLLKDQKGSNNGNCTIDDETVESIRLLYYEGKLNQYAIADMLGIAQSTVSQIVNHKRRSGK